MQEQLLKEYYWIIEKWDKEKIRVKPQNAEYIQDLITSGEGFIKTGSMTINVKDIKSFDQSDIIYTDQKQIEAGAAGAFNDPVIDEFTNSIQCQWVKKSVTRRKWDTYYSNNPSYHRIGDDDSHVMIAFRVATHLVDQELVTIMSDYEARGNHLMDYGSSN